MLFLGAKLKYYGDKDPNWELKIGLLTLRHDTWMC